MKNIKSCIDNSIWNSIGDPVWNLIKISTNYDVRHNTNHYIWINNSGPSVLDIIYVIRLSCV